MRWIICVCVKMNTNTLSTTHYVLTQFYRWNSCFFFFFWRGQKMRMKENGSVCFVIHSRMLLLSRTRRRFVLVHIGSCWEHRGTRCKSLFIAFDNLSTRFVHVFPANWTKKRREQSSPFVSVCDVIVWHIPSEIEHTESQPIFASINSFCVVWCPSTYELIPCVHPRLSSSLVLTHVCARARPSKWLRTHYEIQSHFHCD